MMAGSSHIFSSWLKFCLHCGKNSWAFACFAITVLSCLACMSKISCISLGFPYELEVWPWTTSIGLISALSWATGDRAGHWWVSAKNSILCVLLEASPCGAGWGLGQLERNFLLLNISWIPRKAKGRSWKTIHRHFYGARPVWTRISLAKLLLDWWHLHVTTRAVR